MGIPLRESALCSIGGKNHAVLATVNSDGSPQTSVVWIGRDSGRASMTPDAGRRVDTQLSWKYGGKDPGEDRPGAVRVVVRMEVLKVTGYAA